MEPKDYMGRLAVCQHGVIGRVQSYKEIQGGPQSSVLYQGVAILTGENWQCVRPRWIAEDQVLILKESLQWMW